MDKINFEDLPSENTPINQDNLNLMQSNIEKSVVAIGKTQPSTSENVWIKKGKNLIDPAKLANGTAAKNTGEYSFVGYVVVTDYIKVEPGIYTVKLFNPGLYRIFRIVGYDENKNYMWDDSDFTVTERQTTITTTKYLRICFEYGNYEGLSPQGLMTAQPQLEQGSATSYEAYVEKEILVKNNNGVFEEFYNEGKNVIERIDNDNGTALKFNNGIMIQYGTKNLTTGSNSYSSGFSHYGVSASVNLPTSFSNTNYTVIANANTPIDYIGIVSVNRGTASAFDIRFVSSQANYQRLIYWIAIGNW